MQCTRVGAAVAGLFLREKRQRAAEPWVSAVDPLNYPLAPHRLHVRLVCLHSRTARPYDRAGIEAVEQRVVVACRNLRVIEAAHAEKERSESKMETPALKVRAH